MRAYDMTDSRAGLAAARLIRLRHQERLSYREAESFRQVGAMPAWKAWRRRAARLAARIERLEAGS